jgi:hypothetical protein
METQPQRGGGRPRRMRESIRSSVALSGLIPFVTVYTQGFAALYPGLLSVVLSGLESSTWSCYRVYRQKPI